MGRAKDFAKGVSTSWLATGVAMLYSVATVPLALHYLGAEQFGAWALLLQLYGYFMLLEFGMTGAAARTLIDHKDSREGGCYAEIVTTSNFVFVGQSMLMVVAGWVFAAPITELFSIPEHLKQDFQHLVFLTSCIAALAALTRLFGALLYASQKIDLVNWSSCIGLVAGLLCLWVALEANAGLYALTISQLAAWFVNSLFAICAARKLQLFRYSMLISSGSWSRAKELVAFGKDIFVFNLGSQVLDASQIMIISRTMGLEAAATWAVSTKLFSLVYQLVTRVEGTAVVFFAEMIVRSERSQLLRRFGQVYQLSTILAVSGSALAIACNQTFVSLWAKASLFWGLSSDALMAALVILNCGIRCAADLIIHTKHLGGLRLIYFAEAALFVGLALTTTAHYGFQGLLASAIVAALICRVPYVAWRSSRYLNVTLLTIGLQWTKRPLLMMLIVLPIATYVSNAAVHLEQMGLPLLSVFLFAAYTLGCAIAATLILPRELRTEIHEKVQKVLKRANT